MAHEKVEQAEALLLKVKTEFARGLAQCDDLLELAVFIDPANLFDCENLQSVYAKDGAEVFAGRELVPLVQP